MNHEENLPENPLHPWIEPELEARLVALVLGEASDFEREELARLIGEQPELALFKNRIETLHSLLHEATTGESPENQRDWKLSPERRVAVLGVMGGAEAETSREDADRAMVEIPRQKRRRLFPILLKVAAAVVILGGLATMMIPASSRMLMRKAEMTEGAKDAPSFFALAERDAGPMATPAAAMAAGDTFSTTPSPREPDPAAANRFYYAQNDTEALGQSQPAAEAKSSLAALHDNLALTESLSKEAAPESAAPSLAIAGEPVSRGQRLLEIRQKTAIADSKQAELDFPQPADQNGDRFAMIGHGGATISGDVSVTAGGDIQVITGPAAEGDPSDFDGEDKELAMPGVTLAERGGFARNAPAAANQKGDGAVDWLERTSEVQLSMGDRPILSARSGTTRNSGNLQANTADRSGGEIRINEDDAVSASGVASSGGKIAIGGGFQGQVGAPDGSVALGAGGEIMANGGAVEVLSESLGREAAKSPPQASKPGMAGNLHLEKRLAEKAPAPAPPQRPAVVAGEPVSVVTMPKPTAAPAPQSAKAPAPAEGTVITAKPFSIAAGEVTNFANGTGMPRLDPATGNLNLLAGVDVSSLPDAPADTAAPEPASGPAPADAAKKENQPATEPAEVAAAPERTSGLNRLAKREKKSEDTRVFGSGGTAGAPESLPANRGHALSISGRKDQQHGGVVDVDDLSVMSGLDVSDESFAAPDQNMPAAPPAKPVAEESLRDQNKGLADHEKKGESADYYAAAAESMQSDGAARTRGRVDLERNARTKDKVSRRQLKEEAVKRESAAEELSAVAERSGRDATVTFEANNPVDETAGIISFGSGKSQLKALGDLVKADRESLDRKPQVSDSQSEHDARAMEAESRLNDPERKAASALTAFGQTLNEAEVRSRSAAIESKTRQLGRQEEGINRKTSGLRSGAITRDYDSIDGLISESEASAPTRIDGASPAVLGIAGVFTDPQFQKVVKDLPQLAPPPAALEEKTATDEPFSTFSLHVSDVSFKLAQAALAKGEWPDAATVRIEEFVNAFDYGDPMPGQAEKVACRLEQAIHPFLQQRNLLRVSMRTAAEGRSGGTPLRLTFLLDNSGSMERPDRQETVRRAFAQLTGQLKPIDQVTLISFARQPRLLADKVTGDKSGELVETVSALPSEGGTNLEAALKLAFEKAKEQQAENAQNRIVLLTDGAANLGDAEPESLAGIIETMRNAGIAFDAAGIGAEGLNDEILEALTRKGDGRYYLLDRPEDADAGFARQIAGALRPAAMNVKVQVEWNPERVGKYKLLGFEKHLLKKEDFRNDSVDAAEMAAAEAGVAVYQFEARPDGKGDAGSVSVRFRDMSTGQMVEKRWPIPYDPEAPRPDQAAPSQRIATAAALFAARLKGGPLGEVVDLKTLADLVFGLPDRYQKMERVEQLKQMIAQARQIAGE